MRTNTKKLETYKNIPIFRLSRIIRKSFLKKSPKCLIYGNFGAMNYGDEAILEGQLLDLKKIKGIKTTVVGRFKNELKKRHKGISALSIFDLFDIIKALIRADFIVIGGGGLISKNDNGLVSLIYQFYCLTLFMLIPNIIKKPVYVWGYGIYKNSNKVIISYAISLLKKVKLVSVRDLHSFKLLKFHRIEAIYCKDNSYLMQVSPRNDIAKHKLFKKIYNKTNQNIGLTLKRPENKREEKELTEAVISLVQRHKKTDFWFYALDYQSNYNNDKNFAEEIIKVINEKINHNRVHLVSEILNSKEIFSSFKLMNGIIAMRLHSLIFAHRQNIKFLAVSYDEKCESFLKSINHEYIEVKSINCNLFSKFLKSI